MLKKTYPYEKHEFLDHKNPFFVLYFCFWSGYFAYFWLNVLKINAQGGLSIAQANMWADWALHFMLGTTMSIREWIPDNSPLLWQTPFNYPFATDLLSALLLKAGLPLIQAYIIPSLIFSLLFVYVLYLFVLRIFQQPLIAVLAACLFFLNGGVGLYYLIQEQGLMEILQQPNAEATNIQAHHIHWMSIISSQLLPQRSMLMGVPLTLIALMIIENHFSLLNPQQGNINTPKIRSLPWFISILILGTMPIIHLHSFFAAFVILSCWMLCDIIQCHPNIRKQRLIDWLRLAGITALVASPLLLKFYANTLGHHQFSLHWGWMAQDAGQNPLLFWFNNWTIVPFVAFIALLILIFSKSQRHLGFYILPFALLFLLVNSIQFQPWIWDNSKLLLWASIGFSALSAWFIITLCNTLHKPIALALVGVMFFVMSASGLYDAYRNIRLDHHRYTMYTHEELELSEWVKNNTPIYSNWLTYPKHNHWLSNLTGRQVIISYPGWLWSHGINYQSVERDVKIIFQKLDNALLNQYQVDYVVLDEQAIKEYRIVELLYLFRLKKVKQLGNIRIYQVNKIL